MRPRREHAPELLDALHHDRAELEQSLDHVAEVNRRLGGSRAVLLALAQLDRARRDRTRAQPPTAPPCWTILDIGTGSADIPLAIDDWARRRSIPVHITATDRHPQMREIAAERTRGRDRISVAAADALELHYEDDAFDIVLLSLTLHHFERGDQVRVLREAARVARTAIVVNELERSLPSYLGARFLAATRWRANRLTRHDGPLSVLQAFTARELRAIAGAAGLRVASVRRRLLFRIVLVGAKERHRDPRQGGLPLASSGS
jgi:ubiquinone/menaquinone biosynthesis C-methylase UbiE